MSKKFNFFREAVKNHKTSGTIVPSSRFLAQQMLTPIDFKNVKLIVELGPGNGAITKHILEKIEPKATLICFEINDAFYNELIKIEHSQLIVLKQSAENIRTEINRLGFSEIDYIVSSLPLTIIPNRVANIILEESKSMLVTNGLFMQYQYSLTYLKKLRTVFGKNVSISFELKNFPPAFIYKCLKK